jgi:type II secretion system GspH-like protein
VGRSVGHARVNRASSIVAGDIEQAFAMAARQRKPIRLTFVSGTQSYTINDRASGAILVARSFGPTAEVSLSGLSASATILDIYPSGLASGSDTVTLQLGTYSRRVTVTRVGLIRGIQ